MYNVHTMSNVVQIGEYEDYGFVKRILQMHRLS